MRRRTINLRPGEVVELRHGGRPALLVLLDREGDTTTLYLQVDPQINTDSGTRAGVLLGEPAARMTSKNA